VLATPLNDADQGKPFVFSGGFMDNIPNNPSLKPPKSFEEQIDLMVSRGLIVADREKAISILKRINYYRLSAYTLTLKNRNNQFKKGVTFQEIYLLYEFDQKLRTLLMPLMETVEIAFRTHIAYFLAIKYGNVAHLDKSIFRNEEQFRKFLEDLKHLGFPDNWESILRRSTPVY